MASPRTQALPIPCHISRLVPPAPGITSLYRQAHRQKKHPLMDKSGLWHYRTKGREWSGWQYFGWDVGMWPVVFATPWFSALPSHYSISFNDIISLSETHVYSYHSGLRKFDLVILRLRARLTEFLNPRLRADENMKSKSCTSGRTLLSEVLFSLV